MSRTPLHIPMTGRDPHEEHRVSTPLELFFDLVFVVAVAYAASGLHHDLAENHIRHGLTSYIPLFFALWWAWMNFTWFASAYDTGDAVYTLLGLVQMFGALILAAGIPDAFAERDFRIIVVGYVVMRMAMVVQWLRAARQDPVHRPATLRYAIGVTVVQALWIWWGFTDHGNPMLLWAALMALDLAVPFWAERHGMTSWHPEHIAERYGLFTIIVLGESVLAASNAIQNVENLRDLSTEMVGIIVGGVLILFSMWWIYFQEHELVHPAQGMGAFLWGYGYLAVWAATAAVGVGISLAVDLATDHTALTERETGYALAIPVAVFILLKWLLYDHFGRRDGISYLLIPIAIVAILLAPLTGSSTLAIGLVLVALIVGRTVLGTGHAMMGAAH